MKKNINATSFMFCPRHIINILSKLRTHNIICLFIHHYILIIAMCIHICKYITIYFLACAPLIYHNIFLTHRLIYADSYITTCKAKCYMKWWKYINPLVTDQVYLACMSIFWCRKKKGSSKKFYERRVYESVDDRSHS